MEQVDPWKKPSPPTGFVEESRSFGGNELHVKRRRLSFIEEQRLLPHATNPGTKQIDFLELAAIIVDAGAIEGVNFQLTGDRVRALGADPEQADFAWFLIDWFAKDTMRNLAPNAMEVARGKSGAPLRGAPGTRMPRKPSRARSSATSASVRSAPKP